MAVIVQKGQKVDVTKSNPGLQSIKVGLGWSVQTPGYEIDGAAFLLGGDGKVVSENDFIFYNNNIGGNNSVTLNSNKTSPGDKELFSINLSMVPSNVAKIAFTITIDNGELKRQSFSQVNGVYVRVYNANTNEILIDFNLSNFSVENAIVAAEVYRYNSDWKFNPTGSGFSGGLAALCKNFGIEVAGDAPPTVQEQYVPPPVQQYQQTVPPKTQYQQNLPPQNQNQYQQTQTQQNTRKPPINLGQNSTNFSSSRQLKVPIMNLGKNRNNSGINGDIVPNVNNRRVNLGRR